MDNGEVKCPECGKTFPGESTLSWHRNAVHRQDSLQASEVKPLGETHLQTGQSYPKKFEDVEEQEESKQLPYGPAVDGGVGFHTFSRWNNPDDMGFQ